MAALVLALVMGTAAASPSLRDHPVVGSRSRSLDTADGSAWVATAAGAALSVSAT